ECPRYSPPAQEDPAIASLRSQDVSAIQERAEESDPTWTLLQLLSSPTIASKAWAYRQYDSTVRTNTVIGPGGDAAVLRIRGTSKAIAVKTDCNGRYTYLDPLNGGRIAVAEAARNVACTGARPKAITNCLNFGNPRKPGVYFQLREAIKGMGEACSALSTPVTGGNVSLYNESPKGAVYPTPVVGMVGLIESLDNVTGSTFETPGEIILLVGDTRDELGGTEYLAAIHGVVAGAPPVCDLDAEGRAIDALLEAIAAGAVSSAHDCSDGGLAVALAECCIAKRNGLTGANVDLTDAATVSARGMLFGESQARYVLSSSLPQAVEQIMEKHGVPVQRIGVVTEAARGFTIQFGDRVIESDVQTLAAAWHDAIPAIMSAPVAAVDPEPALTGA
ncbi:MAG TPA: AIR synthase related protein, partial [Gemmatimonadaceae bacterium]|nr:AIR synthase related protein [Gemmatimonadaceae bacterium]